MSIVPKIGSESNGIVAVIAFLKKLRLSINDLSLIDSIALVFLLHVQYVLDLLDCH